MIILVLLVAIVALVPILAKFVNAASSTVSGMVLTYTLSPNLSTGQVCTDDTKCNGTFTCELGPNTATKYCVDYDHASNYRCGKVDDVGYAAGGVANQDECQSDGTWLCNEGYRRLSNVCTQTKAGFFSADDEDAQTACPSTSNGDIFDTSSPVGSDALTDCTSCLYNNSGDMKINASESCTTTGFYNLSNSNLILALDDTASIGNFTVAFNITGIGNWSVCRNCRIVIRNGVRFG